MGKVSPQKARQIKQIVLDCSIRRFTSHETAQYLSQQGFPVEVRTVDRYKARIRASTSEWINNLAISKKNEYLAEHRDRINELMACQQELWILIRDKTGRVSPRTKAESIRILADTTMKLTELYQFLPLINAIRGDGSDYNNDINGFGNGGSISANGFVGGQGSCSTGCSDFFNVASRYRCEYHHALYEREHSQQKQQQEQQQEGQQSQQQPPRMFDDELPDLT